MSSFTFFFHSSAIKYKEQIRWTSEYSFKFYEGIQSYKYCLCIK